MCVNGAEAYAACTCMYAYTYLFVYLCICTGRVSVCIHALLLLC